MNVACPGCSSRYTLPSHLLGPAGARIHCPTCWLTFVIGPDGAVTAVLGRSEPSEANGTNGAHAADAPNPALESLRALDDPPGTLAASAQEGRLFADHGPALLDQFESLEQRLGQHARDAFRTALAELTGIDLSPEPIGTEQG